MIILAIVVGVLLLGGNVLGYLLRDDFFGDDEPTSTATASTPVENPISGPTDNSSPAADAPRLANAVVMTKKFLGYLNTNNQKAASAMGCEGSKQLLPTAISLVVDESTNLTAGTATVEEPGTSAYPMRMDLVTISGTVKYRPTNGWVRIQDVPGEPLCVRMFQTP
ncbi:hypothetical protein EV138_3487 [Kribbella voronezhensis]|uniref:Uncharacterized protein n=1 Tax=Kribbella voronezhensis TaxID=2512212 RepID=A0A4R7TET6_9ACTN|nr:hypothetical protein EV138_3487 [Kribbella voronezhensis]